MQRAQMFQALCGVTVGLGLCLSAAAHAQEEQIRSGFALQAGLATAPQSIDDDLAGWNFLEGQLSLGYKADSLIFSLSFSFNVFSKGSENPNTFPGEPTKIDRTFYRFLVGPEVQFNILRAADKRAELFGHIGLGFGTWDSFTTSSPDTGPSRPEEDETRFLARWRVAPGVRYWMHPNVAVAGAVGIAGDYALNERGSVSSTNHAVSLYGQFGLLGAF